MSTRIPRTIRLPFGYVVKVVITNDENKLEGSDGLWDVDVKTIYIRRSRPASRRRYILGHEIGHAFLDWQHHCFDGGTMDHMVPATSEPSDEA